MIGIEDLLLHPVRMRILLSLVGLELTSRALAERLPDVAHATLYRHIAKLQEAGVLKIVGEEQKRGGRERTYVLASSQYLDLGESFEKADDTARMRYFMTFITSLVQDFALYLERRNGKAKGDFGFQSIIVHLSDKEFADFTRTLNEAVAPYVLTEPGKGRTARTMTTVMIPRLDGER